MLFSGNWVKCLIKCRHSLYFLLSGIMYCNWLDVSVRNTVHSVLVVPEGRRPTPLPHSRGSCDACLLPSKPHAYAYLSPAALVWNAFSLSFRCPAQVPPTPPNPPQLLIGIMMQTNADNLEILLLHFAAEVINPEMLTGHVGTGFRDDAVFLNYSAFWILVAFVSICFLIEQLFMCLLYSPNKIVSPIRAGTTLHLWHCCSVLYLVMH